MYIKVNTNILKNQQKNILSFIEDYENGITNARNTINSISSIWKGKDYDFFSTKTNEFLDELLKLKTTLNQYNEFLNGYVNASEQLDSHYESKKINII